MKILVSACLLGIDCKYNAKNNKNEQVLKLLKDHDLVPVCPEIMGGLPTPRIPSEINGNKVITRGGKNVTKQYQKGAEEALKIAKLYNCQTAILKEKVHLVAVAKSMMEHLQEHWSMEMESQRDC